MVGKQLLPVGQDEWKSIKADLTCVRSEYHDEVAEFLKQVPVFLENEERISRLVKEVRESLIDKIIHRWSTSISAAGWKMFGASASIFRFRRPTLYLGDMLVATCVVNSRIS